MTKQVLMAILELFVFILALGGLGVFLAGVVFWCYELYYGMYLAAFLQFVALFCGSWCLHKYIEWKES